MSVGPPFSPLLVFVLLVLVDATGLAEVLGFFLLVRSLWVLGFLGKDMCFNGA